MRMLENEAFARIELHCSLEELEVATKVLSPIIDAIQTPKWRSVVDELTARKAGEPHRQAIGRCSYSL
jgi:hypothetical protein